MVKSITEAFVQIAGAIPFSSFLRSGNKTCKRKRVRIKDGVPNQKDIEHNKKCEKPLKNKKTKRRSLRKTLTQRTKRKTSRRKTQRRTSRRTSRKTSRRTSRRTSRKTSRRTSRKTSRKTSRRKTSRRNIVPVRSLLKRRFVGKPGKYLCVNSCRGNDKRGYFKGTEPSPKGLGYCAHCMPLNVTMKGKDGHLWENIKYSKGKRWNRVKK